MSSKPITLRAFEISNYDLSKTDSGLFEMLSDKLSKTTVQDRRMLLNDNDPTKEEDLISNFSSKNNSISASLLTIRQGDNTVSIPDDKFNESKFSLSELTTLTELPAIYKDVKYILVHKNWMVVAWFGNKSISSIQTYINWFLDEERKEFIFSINPKVKDADPVKLSQLKSVSIQDTSVVKSVVKSERIEQPVNKELLNLTLDSIKSIFNNLTTVTETKLSEIVSAKLLITFNKPKGMKKEEYEKNFSAMMKPMSDFSDVQFITKDGKQKVNAETILVTKQVKIELTANKQISEKSLYQEMETYLKELKKEYDS